MKLTRVEKWIVIAVVLFILAQVAGCVTVCYDRGPGYSRICTERSLFGG